MNYPPEEILVACKWWVRQLNQSIPLHNVSLFEKHFQERMLEKFDGHWFPENALKGQAFRSVTYDLCVKPDPLLLAAAQDAQLDICTMFPNILENAVMWIDPGEVVVRTTWTYSHRGTEEILYPSDLKNNNMNLNSISQKLTSTNNNKSRQHYSPPKSNGRKNEHNNTKQQNGNNNLTHSDPTRNGTRRPSESKNNNNPDNISLNVYSSVFVPSGYSEYWPGQHERVGLAV